MRFGVLVGLSLALSAWPAQAAVVTGVVLSEDQQPISGAEVQAAGQLGRTDAAGRFRLDVGDDNIVTLSIEHPKYYTILHSFEAAELVRDSELAPVSLVAKKAGRVMFAFGGDVMMGRRYSKPYFGDEVLIHPQSRQRDTKEVVRHIRPYMQLADYSVVNLETQVAEREPSERAPKSVTFITPPETLDALAWAGVDYVTLGNNHTYDYLDSGLKSTLKWLQQSPLAYSGAGVDQAQALAPHVENLGGQDYAMLGYVGWEGGFSPTQTAEKDKGGAAHGSMENLLQSVNSQVAQQRLPIVQYHGSLEYKDEPSGVTEQRLKSALDAGAVMAVAHHPHVAQGFEVYNGKLIAYSMGNFIFDQFFYATPHSLVLYVWMDEGQFHRAEVVPVYLQGYKPVPATGENRFRSLRRLKTLSQKRGTLLSQSGGHGVILPNEKKAPQTHTHTLEVAQQSLLDLTQLPWSDAITGVHTPASQPYRLGKSLTNNGDFERFASFNSPERGWAYSKKHSEIGVENGNHYMQLTLNQGRADWNMKNFARVYRAGNPMTFSARVKVNKPVRYTLYWQGRKTRQKLFDALNQGKKHKVQSIEVTPEQGWVSLQFDFNSPRVGHRSIRTLLEMEGAEGAQVQLDDTNLIQWQSAYTQQPMPVLQDSGTAQATHLGFAKALSGQIVIEVAR